MSIQNFIATYDELRQFLQSYHGQLFYIAIDVENPPDGARAFTIITFPDEVASEVIRRVHRDSRPPRMTPAVQKRINDADLTQTRLACGINIDPLNASGFPNAFKLQGTRWVRFVFNGELHRRSLQDAFVYYDPIIKAYNAAGINVLLVLNQQTYGDGTHFNLRHMDSSAWTAFTGLFVPVVDQIARHYGNTIAAYEIWNEGDIPNNPSSIYIPAADFAPLLARCSEAIRYAAPRAKIILGGLVGGTSISSRYVKDVRTKLNGLLPVDAIGLHPYGLGAPQDNTPFSPYGNIQGVLDAIQSVAPNMPIWLTEFGALGSRDATVWDKVALYMRNMYNYLRPQSHKVPVALWYAWSDGMDPNGGTNGLVTADQKPKPPIYETFFNEACQ